jgi:drug/metabolite transporter (DMT)-like permease
MTAAGCRLAFPAPAVQMFWPMIFYPCDAYFTCTATHSSLVACGLDSSGGEQWARATGELIRQLVGPVRLARAWYGTRMSTARRAYAAFVITCVVWGTTYLAIRIALETIPPMLMASARWIVAGTVLIVALAARGERLPHPREWPALTLLGVLLLGFGNGAVVWAELTVPSGLTAVLVATVPFWMVGVDAISRPAAEASASDRLTATRVAGLLIGFSGILLLVWPELQLGGRRGFLAGVISTQIACCGWALGSSYARRRGHTQAREENVLATAAFEMLFGGLVLLGVGVALGEWSRVSFTTRSALALTHLIVFGSIAGFTAYAYALKHLPVATVSLYAYFNPLIAVVLGVLVLREPFSARMAAAAAIVLAGMALVRRD